MPIAAQLGRSYRRGLVVRTGIVRRHGHAIEGRQDRKRERGAATWTKLQAMAFGQQSGPTASARQVQQLLALLENAGHTDFRDARGPMGFTQRQAAGKFTRDEAAAFIDRLQDSELDGAETAIVPATELSSTEQLVRGLPSERLAAELRRRGWTVAKS